MPFDPNYRPKAITEEINNLTFEPKPFNSEQGLVRNKNGQVVRYNWNKGKTKPSPKTARRAHTAPLELF